MLKRQLKIMFKQNTLCSFVFLPNNNITFYDTYRSYGKNQLEDSDFYYIIIRNNMNTITSKYNEHCLNYNSHKLEQLIPTDILLLLMGILLCKHSIHPAKTTLFS